MFALPALLDTCGSYLNFAGLGLISASSYQILKMLCMVFVVILSVTVLKRSYSLIQYLAILLVMSGLTVVTLTDYFVASSSTDSNDTSLLVLGLICMVIG